MELDQGEVTLTVVPHSYWDACSHVTLSWNEIEVIASDWTSWYSVEIRGHKGMLNMNNNHFYPLSEDALLPTD